MVRIENPQIPFTSNFVGGVTRGKTVKIHGFVQSGADRFSIDINCNDNIALHIAPRFTERCIVRNHFQGNIWGSEERHGGMPLFTGQEFRMEIICETNSYKILINRREFCRFNHRLSSLQATHLYIKGNVHIISIEY